MKRYFHKDSPDRAMLLPAQIVLNLLGEVFWPTQVEIGTGV